jgi:hypothetical protein
MIANLLDMQNALAATWGGSVRLASATKEVEDHVFEVQRLTVDHAPAGAPTTVLLKRVPGAAGASNPEPPTNWLPDVWASLEFMHEIFGEANPLPRLYIGDRQTGWLLMEDLPDNDPLRQALWGSDPQQAQNELVRFMTMLGEMHANTLPHQSRYEELYRALGGSITDHPKSILETWAHTLSEIGFGMPSAAMEELELVPSASVGQARRMNCHSFPPLYPGLMSEKHYLGRR